GISIGGGTFYVDSDVTGTTITGNGRLGIAVLTGHLILNGGDPTVPGTANVISNNTGSGVEVANSAEADINGDNRIIGNHGTFGLVVLHDSSVFMSDGTISNNAGVGVHCGETSHCEWAGTTTIDNNGNGGIAIVDHSDAYLDGGIDVSGNTHNGVYVDLSSVYNSLGGNTINNNTGDGVLLEVMAVAHYTGNDTMTGNTNGPLECDATSLVVGDVISLGKIKCKNVQPQSPTMLTQP
ncbi:MAG TPA: right-handed parallel beta-helix repeat-containing protein, partial [Candidatus Angelobacter sp.]